MAAASGVPYKKANTLLADSETLYLRLANENQIRMSMHGFGNACMSLRVSSEAGSSVMQG